MDYYSTLGVSKNASPEEIKKAYRKLAMQHHPDRTGGDDTRFKQINEAYDTLSNPEKKQHYDNPQPRMDSSMFNQNFGNFDDIFGQMFGGGFGHRQHQPRNKDITIPIGIDLNEVIQGKQLNIQYKLSNGQVTQAQIQIPPNMQNGQTIKYHGLGDNIMQQFPRGDLNVIVKYNRHRYWNVDGPHLRATEKIPLLLLLKGTTIDIVTVEGGTLRLTIPRGTNPGTTFSISGSGLPTNNNQRGNAYVKVNVSMPVLNEMQLMEIEKIIGNNNN